MLVFLDYASLTGVPKGEVVQVCKRAHVFMYGNGNACGRDGLESTDFRLSYLVLTPSMPSGASHFLVNTLKIDLV